LRLREEIIEQEAYKNKERAWVMSSKPQKGR
jgi:hypothetical protein